MTRVKVRGSAKRFVLIRFTIEMALGSCEGRKCQAAVAGYGRAKLTLLMQ